MPTDMSQHDLTADRYRLDELHRLATAPVALSLAPDVRHAIQAGADFVRRLAGRDEHLYGVNTGFGALCEVRIAPEEIRLLQRNHLLSHAAGIGAPVGERHSRLTLLIKLLTLRSGRTGIGLAPVDRLVALWNLGAIPVIPLKGTVGASGDLAPLAHMSLPLLGLGQVHLGGEIVAASVLAGRFGLQPLDLEAKEGLALTNGIQYLAAHATDAVMRLSALADAADYIAALSAQAFSASNSFTHPLYHATTTHLDRRTVAGNLRAAMQGGNHAGLPTANRSSQDPYSFRCIPQVHGAVRQLIGFCWRTVEDELNGVSDNPLFFAEAGLALFGGNLHGQSTAFALDILAMAGNELASISERRTFQLHSGRRGLPDFLAAAPGVNSGLMIAQYTAAALVNETKTLCHPASTDTIPTCQMQEDHVSMGGTAAYKLATIIDNLEYVLAIELVSAAQAAEMLAGLVLSAPSRALLAELRAHVAFLDVDRPLAEDIASARSLVRDRAASWSQMMRNLDREGEAA